MGTVLEVGEALENTVIYPITQLFYSSGMSISDLFAGVIAFVVSLEFIASVISSLSRMGR